MCDMEVDPYPAIIAPASIPGDKPALSSSNNHALRRQDAMADVGLTSVWEQEKSHKHSIPHGNSAPTTRRLSFLATSIVGQVKSGPVSPLLSLFDFGWLAITSKTRLQSTLSALKLTHQLTNIITEMPAKKPWTNLHSHTVAEGSGHSAPAMTLPSQASSMQTDSMGSGHVCYINGHLPLSLQEDRKWTKQVLPALVTWARSLGNPWVIPDQDLMWALQTIITTVNSNFGNLTAIHPGAPVFILVPFSFVSVAWSTHFIGQATWQLSVWHSNFSSTALAIMAHFLASGTDHVQLSDIHEMCNELLDGLAFLYQDLDPSKPENAYQSQFLLQLLAHMHLQPCIGCLDIPKLDTSALKEHGVKGALSLSCAMWGDLQVKDQLSACGKATARTPLKLNKTSGQET
ncbi:hypothetical protein EDD16DRAFT_1516144 [Pisolithus croceorrhizus]|nr:hypothetical protein EDD16DRAFT_1516144 [Pisolithus croceorrhizus]KAI6133915.1 hypothetical protein EV401DRAFT_1883084 [Pisolithus croceorrhizus]KAI6162862.1 hypothetical protein EDD17DRAFT_1507722 [Pisolithus thermaeus]